MTDEVLDRLNTLVTRVEKIAEDVADISRRLDKVEARSDLADLKHVDKYKMKQQMWNDTYGEEEEADFHPLRFLDKEIRSMRPYEYTMPKKD